MPDNNPRIPFELSCDRPAPAPYRGKQILVHIVVNLEVWPFDRAMPRALLENPHGRSPVPDIANYSWVEYGLRAGVPRLARIFSERGLPVTNMMNATFPDYYPQCAEFVQKAGWELAGHGLYQRSLQLEEDEEAIIETTLEKLERFDGKRPRGWLGPGFGESLKTPDILRGKGIEYVYEWMVDDIPSWMRTEHGRLLAIPYALDLNDVMVFAIERHTADEYYKRFAESVAYFASEPGKPPRILTMALHPHIIATPYRLAMFERTVDMLLNRDDTQFVVGSHIADWFMSQSKGE